MCDLSNFCYYSFSNASAHAASDRLNVAHGGLSPSVTNVIFTHGNLDPWRTIGVLEDVNPEATVLIIDGKYICKRSLYSIINIFYLYNIGSAQSTDLLGFSENDTQAETDAKLIIKELIRYWVAHDDGIEIVPY